MKQKIKVERRVHQLWRGSKYMQKILKAKIPCVVGKYHYIYSSKKGTISLIKIGSNLLSSWQMCGGGIVETQRFLTKMEADRVIRRLLS